MIQQLAVNTLLQQHPTPRASKIWRSEKKAKALLSMPPALSFTSPYHIGKEGPRVHTFSTYSRATVKIFMPQSLLSHVAMIWPILSLAVGLFTRTSSALFASLSASPSSPSCSLASALLKYAFTRPGSVSNALLQSNTHASACKAQRCKVREEKILRGRQHFDHRSLGTSGHFPRPEYREGLESGAHPAELPTVPPNTQEAGVSKPRSMPSLRICWRRVPAAPSPRWHVFAGRCDDATASLTAVSVCTSPFLAWREPSRDWSGRSLGDSSLPLKSLRCIAPRRQSTASAQRQDAGTSRHSLHVVGSGGYFAGALFYSVPT